MARSRGRRSSPLYVTPAFDLLPKSYGLVKTNLRIFALLFIFPLIIGLSNGFWVVDTQRHLRADILDAFNAVGNATLPSYSFAKFGITFLIALAVAASLQVMMQTAQLYAAKHKKIKLSHLWQTLKGRGLQMFYLYSVVSILSAVGLVIFVIPGLIILKRYFLAPYVLLENEDMSIWQAMERSSALTKRDSWSVYTMIGVMLLFSLFGIVPYIGWIAAFLLHFFYSVAPVLRYQELKRLGNG